MIRMIQMKSLLFPRASERSKRPANLRSQITAKAIFHSSLPAQ